MNYQGYKDLECYKQARELRIFISVLAKTMEHLCTAFDEHYINQEELKAGEERCELVFKLINGYINYLDKSRNEIKK